MISDNQKTADFFPCSNLENRNRFLIHYCEILVELSDPVIDKNEDISISMLILATWIAVE